MAKSSFLLETVYFAKGPFKNHIASQGEKSEKTKKWKSEKNM